LVCINDVHLSEEKFRRYKGLILGAFKDKFPEKSRFER
jgi:hypothetical protein